MKTFQDAVKEIAEVAKVLNDAFGENKPPGALVGDVRCKLLELSVQLWFQYQAKVRGWADFDDGLTYQDRVAKFLKCEK